MPHKSVLMVLALLMVLPGGCSRRRTRQFVVPESPPGVLEAGEWQIDPPTVVAFKDAVNLADIADTTMFWVTMRAKRLNTGSPGSNADLLIDSISISFAGDNTRYWRSPTRVAPYGSPGDDYTRKIFDFFGDQGIVIPAGIDTIVVAFDATVLSDGGEAKESYPFRVELVRDEISRKVPLLRE